MWAQQLVAPRILAEVEAPAPRREALASGQVLLQVLAGGICGSDLTPFLGFRPLLMADQSIAENPPGFPMHEVVGEVLASTDPAHSAGDRVVGWGTRFNVMCEQIVCNGDDLFPSGTAWPPELTVTAQPLACVLYAVQQLPDVRDKDVAVLGQGPIGLLFSHVLKAFGAKRVTGVDRVSRAEVSKIFSVDEAVHAHSGTWVQRLTPEDRPEIIVEAIGHNVSTLDHAVQAVKPGGQIYYFGVPDDETYPLNMHQFMRKNLTLLSGVTLQRQRMLREALDYLREHRQLPGAYVTDVKHASDAQQAFELALGPTSEQIKVTVTMP